MHVSGPIKCSTSVHRRLREYLRLLRHRFSFLNVYICGILSRACSNRAGTGECTRPPFPISALSR